MEKHFYKLLYEHETAHWWYCVRRKLVHKLIKLYCLKKHLEILDIGCGTGKLLEELKQNGNITGIDKSIDAISFCKTRRLKNVEAVAIEEFKTSKQFDCILALDILEHCQNDRLVIKKIYSLLKPEGVIIIFVPASKYFWGKQDEISHHFRRYTYKELKEKFQNNNFKILKQSHFNFFFALPIFTIRKITNLSKKEIKSELQFNNPFVNKICKFIFGLELFLLPKIKFPFGVSLIGVYKKHAQR